MLRARGGGKFDVNDAAIETSAAAGAAALLRARGGVKYDVNGADVETRRSWPLRPRAAASGAALLRASGGGEYDVRNAAIAKCHEGENLANYDSHEVHAH